MIKEERRRQMLKLVEQWQQSGMSQQAFAREHHINVFTLRYWINKKRQQQNSEENEGSGFIQLNNLAASGGIILHYPNGIELYLPLHTPVSMIKSLVNG